MPENLRKKVSWKIPAGTQAEDSQPVSWQSLDGPEGGDVISVKWCKSVTGRSWAGTLAGDLFRKDDLTTPWKRCSPPMMPRSPVISIEVSTGAIPSVLVAYQSGSVFASPDSGTHWENTSAGLSPGKIHLLAAHPLYPAVILAGCDDGLFISANGGRKWSRFPKSEFLKQVTAIEYHQSDPRTFWIADTGSGISAIWETVNGGQSFQQILLGGGKFLRIQNIVHDEPSGTLWASGYGALWSICRCTVGDPNSWERRENGLPKAGILCCTLTSPQNLWVGTDGYGLFRYIHPEDTWKSIFPESDYRFVKCLDAAEEKLIAGFINSGTAFYINDAWWEKNRGLTAKNLQTVIALNKNHTELNEWPVAVVSNKSLYIRSPIWKNITGLENLTDVRCNSGGIFAASSSQGLLFKRYGLKPWDDLNIPMKNVLKISFSEKNKSLFALVKQPGGQMYVYKWLGDTHWRQVGDGIDGRIEVYAFASGNHPDKTLLMVATIAGVFYFDEDSDHWQMCSGLSEPDIRTVAASTANSMVFYAGNGNKLIISQNGGKNFEPGYLKQFPSAISSIFVHGIVFETIWVGTTGGGLYVSFLPNIWLEVTPGETGVGMTSLSLDPFPRRTLFTATQGISCTAACIPSLKLRLKFIDGDRHRVFLTLDNPCNTMPVNFFLVQIPTDSDAIYYHINQGQLTPSSSAVSTHFIYQGQIHFPEISLGEIQVTHPGSILAGGLFNPASGFPIASIEVLKIPLIRELPT